MQDAVHYACDLMLSLQVVLGPYGYQLADSVFMSPPAWQDRDGVAVTTRAPAEGEQMKAAPLLMEFFPPGVFVPDQEFAIRSLGMRYVGWWNERCGSRFTA